MLMAMMTRMNGVVADTDTVTTYYLLLPGCQLHLAEPVYRPVQETPQRDAGPPDGS